MLTLDENIELLNHSRSSKRRSAAKRLRKLGDVTAGPALLTVLRKEIEDPRTWETQYQMVMAIGHCNYIEALPFIESLTARQFVVMIDIAIGDTMLRLSRKHENDADIAVRFIDSKNASLAQGALQAIAMLRMCPSDTTMHRLIEHGMSLELGDDDWTVIWLLRAIPGWPETLVKPLLDKWSTVKFEEQQQIHSAVDLASKRKYYKWSPA